MDKRSADTPGREAPVPLRLALIDLLQLKIRNFVAADFLEYRRTARCYGTKVDRKDFIEEIRGVLHDKLDEAIDDVFAEDTDLAPGEGADGH